MQTSRFVVRASRGARVNTPALRRNARRYAEAPNTASSSGAGSAPGASHALAYGLTGGAIGSLLIGTAFYQFSGVGKAAQSARTMKSYVDGAVDKLKIEFNENTPDTNEAIETLKQSAYKYATFIPGGRDMVDRVFKDIEIVRKKHGKEVDDIVSNAYGELRDATKKGMSLETASQAWEILAKYLQQLGGLAVDAGQDILGNHPELKNKLGGSFDQLKQLGDNLGPEAKQQVEETYKDIKGIINQGVQWDTVEKVRKLVQEKVKKLRELSDKAWQQGYEQIQSTLDKNPEAKKLVEQNMDVLKSGNVTEALDKVRQAVSSGDTSGLEEYVQQAKKKGSQFAGDFSSWFQAVPHGSQIFDQLQKLKKGAESQAPEAQKLAQDTFNELKSVLEKRGKQIEDLFEKAQKGN